MIHIYDFLITLLKPLIVLIGKIGMPHRKVTGETYYKIRDQIKPGMVLLTKTNWEMSNLINPCPIKHAALYVGESIYGRKPLGTYWVLESTGNGVNFSDLVSFLLSKDRVICVEYLLDLTLDPVTELPRIIQFVGSSYDYTFTKGGKSFYCFELVATILETLLPDHPLKTRTVFKGKKIYDHNTFLDPKRFRIVFDTEKL